MVIHGVTVTAVTVSAIGKTRFSALEMAGLRVTSEFQGELIVTWQCKTWEHQLMEVPSDAKTDIDFFGCFGCLVCDYIICIWLFDWCRPQFLGFHKKNASAGLCRGLSCDLNCAATAATSPLVDGPMAPVDTKMGLWRKVSLGIVWMVHAGILAKKRKRAEDWEEHRIRGTSGFHPLPYGCSRTRK